MSDYKSEVTKSQEAMVEGVKALLGEKGLAECEALVRNLLTELGVPLTEHSLHVFLEGVKFGGAAALDTDKALRTGNTALKTGKATKPVIIGVVMKMRSDLAKENDSKMPAGLQQP